MKNSRRYKIEIFGLSNDAHQFSFEYDESFFSEFENSLIIRGNGTCNVDLVKSDSMLDLTLKVTGFIELTCDRSLDTFDYPISFRQEIIYKYGDEEKELSENVFVVPKNTQEINISNFLYEYISLEVPMKKLHPRFENDEDSDELIYSSKEENESTERTDPRWEALKKLKK
ncbi:MAG: DUF177 domain-containing protein [Cyclobacteriaceae bacterium]